MPDFSIPNRTLSEIVGQRVTPRMTVRQACGVLANLNVAAAAVIDEKKLVGIFTERDVVRKCICQSRGSEETCVSDIMTPNPTVVGVNGNLTQALHIMLKGHFRHLPIVDGDEVLGILSMREIPLDNRIMHDRYFEVAENPSLGANDAACRRTLNPA